MSYKANTDDLRYAAEAMHALTREMQDTLEALDRAKVQFTSANQGMAIGEYEIAQQEWNRGLQQMSQSMTGRAQAVSQSTDNYEDADRRGSQIISAR